MQPRQVAMASSSNAATTAVTTMVRSSASMTRSVPYCAGIRFGEHHMPDGRSGGRNVSRTCATSVTKPPAAIARTVVLVSLRRANSAVNAINAMVESYGKTSTATHAATNVACG